MVFYEHNGTWSDTEKDHQRAAYVHMLLCDQIDAVMVSNGFTRIGEHAWKSDEAGALITLQIKSIARIKDG